MTEAAFHDVRDQRLDDHDLATLCVFWNVDEGADWGYQMRSSRQARSVVITSTLSDQNELSDISQTAMTFSFQGLVNLHHNDMLADLGIVVSGIAVMLLQSPLPDLLIGLLVRGIVLKGGWEILG